MSEGTVDVRAGAKDQLSKQMKGEKESGLWSTTTRTQSRKKSSRRVQTQAHAKQGWPFKRGRSLPVFGHTPLMVLQVPRLRGGPLLQTRCFMCCGRVVVSTQASKTKRYRYPRSQGRRCEVAGAPASRRTKESGLELLQHTTLTSLCAAEGADLVHLRGVASSFSFS